MGRKRRKGENRQQQEEEDGAVVYLLSWQKGQVGIFCICQTQRGEEGSCSFTFAALPRLNACCYAINVTEQLMM